MTWISIQMTLYWSPFLENIPGDPIRIMQNWNLEVAAEKRICCKSVLRRNSSVIGSLPIALTDLPTLYVDDSSWCERQFSRRKANHGRRKGWIILELSTLTTRPFSSLPIPAFPPTFFKPLLFTLAVTDRCAYLCQCGCVPFLYPSPTFLLSSPLL